MSNDSQNVFETILTQSETALERWYRGDPFGYLDLMAEEMTYFSPFMNTIIDGKSANEAMIAPLAGQIHSPGFEVRDPKLQLGEDMAVITFNLNELDEEGALNVGWKVTEVYRQVGDNWRTIHAHFSPIVENQ